MTTVLHVFPDSVVDPAQRHLGSTKDIRGRTQYFRDRSMTVTELVHERSARGMAQAVEQAPPAAYDAVVVEFPLSVRAARLLRRRHPDAVILTRSENAELLHRWDWMRAKGASVSSAKLGVRTALNVAAEVAAGRSSDTVIAISDWEAEHYWPRLAPRAVRCVPYFVPDDYLAELAYDAAAPRRQVCVCLTSTKTNPLITDSVHAFRRAVEGLADSDGSDGWRFLMTGDVGGTAEPGRIEHTGMLASPGEILTTTRAVALLSDLGYGFKTKLLEAIVAGNRVIVTPGLHRRMPPSLDPWTIRVDPATPGSFAQALEQADAPLPAGDANAALRDRAYATLDQLLRVPATA